MPKGAADNGGEPSSWISRVGPWLVAAGLLAVTAMTAVSLGRFLEWDEAVFYGQSGGYEGAQAAAPALAPSREMGPVVLIRVLRFVASDLPEVRLLWAALSIASVVLAYRSLEPHIGRVASVLASVLFGTFWIPLMFTASFYASLFGSMFALSGTAAYLRFRRDATWMSGLIVGGWFAAAFWMRQIESAIVLVVLVIHVVVTRSGRDTIKEGWRGLVAGAFTFAFAFIVPWAIDATVRYGSVLGRLRAGQSQGYPRGLRNNLTEYGQLLVGSGHFRAFEPIPTWAVRSIIAVGVVLTLVSVAALALDLTERRTSRRARSGVGLMGLMLVLAGASFAFFFFYAGGIRERYMLFGLAFLSVVFSQAVASVVRRLPAVSGAPGIIRGPAFVLALGVWLAANQSVVQPLQAERVFQSQLREHIVTVVRSLEGDGPCAGVSRWSAPALQVGSGCTFMRRAEPQGAIAFARAVVGRPGTEFVVWPSSEELDLPPAWETIEVSLDRAPDRSMSVHYRIDDGE